MRVLNNLKSIHVMTHVSEAKAYKIWKKKIVLNVFQINCACFRQHVRWCRCRTISGAIMSETNSWCTSGMGKIGHMNISRKVLYIIWEPLPFQSALLRSSMDPFSTTHCRLYIRLQIRSTGSQISLLASKNKEAPTKAMRKLWEKVKVRLVITHCSAINLMKAHLWR